MNLSAERLEGQVALVTGASSGIGRAIALALAARRVSLALVGRDVDRLRDVSERADGGLSRIYPVDLSDAEAPLQMARQLINDFGRLHVLIHAAGQFAGDQVQGPTSKTIDPTRQWELHQLQLTEKMNRLYAVNVRTPFVLTHCLLPLLVQSKGQIVFVNSSAVRFPKANLCAYTATKQALLGIADCLRAEVNHLGVRVLSVFPGRTATPLQERVHEAEGKHYQPDQLLQPEDVATTVMNALETQRTAEITEIYVRPMKKA